MRRIFLLAAIFSAASVAVSQTSAGEKQVVQELKQNAPIEREIGGGDVHSYKVDLKAAHFLYAVVDQCGIDLIVRVFDPSGKQLEEIDSPNGDRGPEPILLTTTAAGVYRLEVRPLDEKAKAARYEIKIEQSRPAATTLGGRVDQLFAIWDKADSPGAAVAVIKNGQVAYKRGYGAANLEYDIPISPTTIFHVASVSKQFTAFAVTMLAQQGKLSLDDDVRKHLPELPDFGKVITLRHLIHHVSGLRDQWELLAMAGWRLDDVITKDQIIRMVTHERELNFDPGHEFLYCNTGYTLLAEVAARVSGQSFRKFTEVSIFKPLGMTNTHFHDDHQMIVKNRAYSYAPLPTGGYRLSALNYANAGATSLFTTVEDMAKWVLNFDEARVGGKSVIEQMHQRGVLNNGEKLDYAFGLSIGEYKGLKTVSHSGGDAGYRSYVVRFPEQQFAVVVLSNLASFNPGRLGQQVADIYLEGQFKPAELKAEAKKQTEVKVDVAVLNEYAGMYQLMPGFFVTVSVENGQLMTQAMGEPKFRALANSETTFYVPERKVTIQFQRDERGKVSHIEVQGVKARRVFPFKPTTQELADFVGDYYSDELGTTYEIRIMNGQLSAQHRRHGDVQLTPTVADQFSGAQWFFRNLEFVRDPQKRITGFRLTGGRVRNMRFDKQTH